MKTMISSLIFVLLFGITHACVTVDKDKGTYTVDGSGHVKFNKCITNYEQDDPYYDEDDYEDPT